MQKCSYKELQEDALWNLLISGDQVALEFIYRKYYPILLNYGLKFGLDDEFVEDCIHDLFIRIFDNRRLSTPEHIGSYLLGALRNLIFDHNRMKGRYSCIDDMDFFLLVDETTLSSYMEECDERKELARKLLSACEALPSNQRHAIYLHYTEGLNYREMSCVLNINVQSAMNLVTRALANIRSHIG